ncbi:MT-A70 family methyltransferase [Pseudothauera hydrothermalis]|uniref:MT-A70 family methyltransferase n=1 Tax=Pseudothauera hydrothermalis TaxID=2184083 RepID=UPI00196791CD|nr:MT-A70 family methyltransferase [Pseudothauera hydrothermalis]
MGFYFRNVTELILFGVRGKDARTLAPGRTQVNMIETRKREHSRKPDEQYALIEACSPGPFLELFARHPRDGWVVWGNEADEDVVPRGRIPSGYAGDAILPPNTHGMERESVLEVAFTLRAEYERGKSVRDLAQECGYPIQRVRTLLQLAHTPMRPRGRPAQEPVVSNGR